MFEIGDKVQIASDNDNENYKEFRGQILIVFDIATDDSEHVGYDESMNGMPLYDLTDEQGNYLPFSLYEYELEESE